MSSGRSALESSASQLESVTASAVSLSALTGTSVQKGSPVKLKVASPRPKRWPKHSTAAPNSLYREGRMCGSRRKSSIMKIITREELYNLILVLT